MSSLESQKYLKPSLQNDFYTLHGSLDSCFTGGAVEDSRAPLLPHSGSTADYHHNSRPLIDADGNRPLINAEGYDSRCDYRSPPRSYNELPAAPMYGGGATAAPEDKTEQFISLLTTVLNTAGEVLSQNPSNAKQTDLQTKIRGALGHHTDRKPYAVPMTNTVTASIDHPVRFQKPKDSNLDDEKPSKVVHCRAVTDGAKEANIVDAMKQFGEINAVTIMPKIRQALVEFQELDSAIECITYSQTQPIVVLGRQLFIAYSKSQSINRGMMYPPSNDNPPSKTLLFTIVNAMHPVTVETIKIITRPHAQVQRIVFFHKNGLQAMVEFDTIEDANVILQKLNGYDIFSGCCTLKIDYAKAGRLNVYKNSDETYDIEIERQVIAAGSPRASVRPAISSGMPNSFGAEDVPSYFGNSAMRTTTTSLTYPALGIGAVGGEGCVLIVYGINPEKFNCAKLFNLFCLYGNVVKIKIFIDKTPGMVMIQYTDPRSTSIAIQLLNHSLIFEEKLSLQVSKHPYVAESKSEYKLPDGTPACKSFVESKNNRFKMIPGGVDPFSRIQPPSKVVHYFNAPPELAEERLRNLLKDAGTEEPIKMAAFNKAGVRHSSGLLEFSDVKSAIEAIVSANHEVMYKDETSEGQAFTLKLAFSSSSQINEKRHQSDSSE